MIILPSMLSPFGLYLTRVEIEDAVPQPLLEPARLGGTGEFRISALARVRRLVPGLLKLVITGWVSSIILPFASFPLPSAVQAAHPDARQRQRVAEFEQGGED
jgi:multiple sugar transport system permease protein